MNDGGYKMRENKWASNEDAHLFSLRADVQVISASPGAYMLGSKHVR